MFWKIIGSTAAVLTMFGFVPQVVKILKTRSAKDVSKFTLLQFLLGTFLWAAYGAYLKDPIIIIANIVTMLTLTLALILYARYK